MKISLFIRLVLVLILGSLIGCGSGNTSIGGQTGSLRAQLQWIERTNSSSIPSSDRQSAAAPQGVATVRIVVSAPGMLNIQKDFPAAAGTGVIDGILAGSNRTLTAQGLNAAGAVTHQGVIENITVQSGQVTDAGIVIMLPIAPQTFAVSGKVTSDGAGMGGVTVTLSGSGLPSATTASDGTFTFTVQNGSYTVTPSKAGFTFTPANRLVNVNNSDVTGQDFAAATIPVQTFTVSGRVTANGSGLQGVTVSLQGTAFTTVTGPDGTYSFTGVPNGSYTAIASLTGFTFPTAPISVGVNNSNVTGLDITATPTPVQTFTISGRVTLNGSGLSGVTVSLQGTSFSAVTGANGAYAISGVSNGAYTAVPSLTGFTFTPANRPVTISNGNMTGQDFTAAAIQVQTHAVSGTITLNGSGLSGVSVSIPGTLPLSVTSGADGTYTLTGLQNGLYTVIPFRTGYAFTPVNRSVSVNNSDVTGQDFTAAATALPTGFPATVPAGNYRIDIQVCVQSPQGNICQPAVVGADTIANADINQFAQDLIAALNTASATSCSQTPGVQCSFAISYTSWNGTSFTITDTFTITTANGSATGTITFTVTKI
jgi:hypothetical protein